ncbi:TIGR02450 family Trp-rich protein [Pseudomonas sp. MBLB4123]
MPSKWTARQPHNREKPFPVIELVRDEQDEVVAVELPPTQSAPAPNTYT